MTTFNLSDTVVAAIVARLASDLPAQIDAVNATVTDGTTIDQVPTDHLLDYVPSPGDLQIVAGGTVIGVQDFPATFQDDTGFAATGVYQHAAVIFVADASTQALARKLRRYQRAVASALLRDRNLGTAAWGTRLVRIVPGPTIEHPTEPTTWLSWTAVVIEAKSDE